MNVELSVLSVCSIVYGYGMFYVWCDYVEANKHIHIFKINLHYYIEI